MPRASAHFASQRPGAVPGSCDHPACTEPGLYRAPKSPDRLRDYFWFCLEHVREYNAAWNFYGGMAEPEIEAQIRFDAVWQRPTWRMGRGGIPGRDPAATILDDGPGGMFSGAEQRKERARPRRPLSPEEKALAVLDLAPPVTWEEIKVRYKTLAKRLHPDANGGDKEAEEQLKVVNEAYSALKHSAFPQT